MFLKNKIPNAEQKKAIHHRGGKILSAGAGSGKTFVLIEHIIERLKILKAETRSQDWEIKIPKKMSKIVMMTFTKKAAGEMSVRMMKRIDELESEEADETEKKFWQIIQRNITSLNVATISSLCHQLINAGYLPHVGKKVEILSNIEFKNKMSKLFNNWLVLKNKKIDQMFEANSRAIVSALVEIYQSPELRMAWQGPLEKKSAKIELGEYLEIIIERFDFKKLFNNEVDLSFSKEDSKKTWYLLLQKFEKIRSEKGILSPENLVSYIEWATGIERLPPAGKNMTASQEKEFEMIKQLVRELKDSETDLLEFNEHYDIYWKWVEMFKEIYDFFDENYLNEDGLIFSDLEYFVCMGMRDEKTAEKIRKKYDYFIVDEFQDTSSVQFEIIKHLTGNKWQNFFCVGDRKQAIYGFRGGEVLVFNQAAAMMGIENNISLKNNFRSLKKIITFNNAFFSIIFPLAYGFHGAAKNGIEMEEQLSPLEEKESGIVEKIVAEVSGAENFKKINVDDYEARALYQKITEFLNDDKIKTICVLYRRLKPSSYLLDLLSTNEKPFSAQVKVSYGEDPILNLFLRLIELKLNQENPEKCKSTEFLIDKILAAIGLEIKITEWGKKFLLDVEMIGFRMAFHKILYSLGICNSLHLENSKLLDSISRVCLDDPLEMHNLLSEENDETYSFEMMNGQSDKKITIMSAHASKGLEFDAVLIGGIYSNGRAHGKTSIVGKWPKSFKWKKEYNQKKFYKSPLYYLESAVEKENDFAESKRLLYVVATRAVKYLGWVDLWAINDVGEKTEIETGENDWIVAMRTAANDNNLFDQKYIKIEYEKKKNTLEVPLLLKDWMGLLGVEEKNHLGLFAEVSVTRLADLSQCPFKFYLANICKIKPPQEKREIFYEEYEEDATGEEIFYSSKKRGTEVHEYISKILLGKINVSHVPVKEQEKIEWVMSEIKKTGSGRKIISEKPVKFSFFGQMISGTPDLVFESTDEIIVWDFKTGKINSEEESTVEKAYWFQLMCYAYAYANLKHFTPEKIVPLSLAYLDEKKIVTRKISLSEITRILFEKWSMLESLDQTNEKHCKDCEYSSVCRYNKTFAP